MYWSKLSMADRAKYIELAVANGVTHLGSIRDTYNSYADGGGLFDNIISWFKGGNNTTSNQDTPKDNTATRISRVKENDSPTKDYSTKLENSRAKIQEALLSKAASKGYTSNEYYIPYIDKKEVKVPGVGRVSTNTLDSIAVNAERAGIPIPEALGLASIETKFGASPNLSVDGYKKSNPNATDKQIQEFERASLNASFMRNFGGIHPQFLVNDHEWSNRGWEESSKYKSKLQGIRSPLQHAFTLYQMGLYNTGDKNHTPAVKSEGQRLMKLPVIKEWYDEYKKSKATKKKQ